MNAAVTYFWISPDWQADYEMAWRAVARRFAGDPMLVGYDLYNEPHPLPIPPRIFEDHYLWPLYARTIAAIGAVDPGHLFLVEGTLVGDLGTTVRPLHAPDVVYSPHLYTGALVPPAFTGDPGPLDRRIAGQAAEAAAVPAPMWTGELGIDHHQAHAAGWADAALDALDDRGAGWAWWQWRESPSWGIRDAAGGFVDWDYLRHLARPYAVAAPPGVHPGRGDGVHGHLALRVDPGHGDGRARDRLARPHPGDSPRHRRVRRRIELGPGGGPARPHPGGGPWMRNRHHRRPCAWLALMRNRRRRERTRAGLVLAAAQRYWNAGGPNWAAAVGLRLLLALLPIAVLAGVVIQEFLPHTTPTPSTATTPRHLGGGGGVLQSDEQSLTSLLSGLIGGLHTANHTLGILSLLGLLWVGSGLFACLESTCAALFASPGRSYLRQRALGIGLVLAFAAVVVIGILSSVLLFPLGSAVQHTGGVGRSVVSARYTLQPVVGIVIGLALFTLVFRVLPTCQQRWSDVLPGVLVASAGNALLNLIWPLYLRYAASTLTVSFVVFGFVVALATYVSVLAQLVVMSLALNATVRARRMERTATAASLATAASPG